MTTSFFDLLQPGMKLDLGKHTFETEEITRFAKKFDHQPFHIDEDLAKKSVFGGLAASGWHSASMWMRHNVAHGMDEMLRLTGYVGPPPILGPSPGVRNLCWHKPVYVGDTIHFYSTISGKRTNPKRAGWGMVTTQSGGVNQRDELVISHEGAVTLRTD